MSRNRPTRGNSSTTVAGEPAAIYCRISQADDDDQTGVDRQERICREIAERRGLAIDPAHVFAVGLRFLDHVVVTDREWRRVEATSG